MIFKNLNTHLMPADFSAMLRRLKRNEAAKAARRDMQLRKKKRLLSANGYSKVKEFDFPEVSKKELATIKEAIRTQIQKDKRKSLLLLLILSISALFIVFYYVDFTNTQESQVQELNVDRYLSEQINEYSYFLKDGDKWIEQRHWHNAIYRYGQVVELFPQEYEANYRLALAYSYDCKFENRNCIQGKKLTARLLKYHPDEINLIKLKVAFQDYARKRMTEN